MNLNPRLAQVRWVKSSYSGPEGGNCLEVAADIAAVSGVVPVRDSKNPEGVTLAFPISEWRHFVDFARQQGI